MHDIDTSSYEIGAIQLTLRPELAFRRQSFGNEICYVIEDSAKSRFFRIGIAEYTFLSLLDGRTSIANAVAETANRSHADAFTETQAAAFCCWLIENGLAITPQSTSSDRLIAIADSAASKRSREWLNPIMMKFPLGNPNRIIQAVHRFTGWAFGSVGAMLWLVVVAIGGYFLLTNFERFSQSSSAVLSPDNWIWLAITWLGLKLLHEFAHGLVCRRFGGDTHEAGVLFLLFMPLPYVDVTSSWRFGSKWQRVFVAAAGMYAEVFVAALAAIAWANTTSPFVQHHACNIMLTAGFVTVLFNINPLMRFDGYYIVSDLLELPNVATHGQQDLSYLSRRYLLGVTSERPDWPEGRVALIRGYGIAAFCWRIMICVSLILASAALFHGAGIVLAVVAIAMWVLVPCVRFFAYIVGGDSVNPPNRVRFATIAAIGLAVGYGVWNYVPYVDRIRLAAVVDYDPVVSVRGRSSGFVRRIHVQQGDFVDAGQPLFQLQNPDLEARRTEVELAIKMSQLAATKFHQLGEMASYQIERENELALQQRLTELQQQCDQLFVTAPAAGQVLSSRLKDLNGRWLAAGTELCLLGDVNNRSVHVVVPQSDLQAISELHAPSVNVHIWGMGTSDLEGQIEQIDPRGSLTLKYPALAAAAGGPLAVQATQKDPNKSSTTQTPDWQLLEPHFAGIVRLQPGSLNQFASGQLGFVEVTTNRGTVGEVLTMKLCQFYSEQKTTTRDSVLR